MTKKFYPVGTRFSHKDMLIEVVESKDRFESPCDDCVFCIDGCCSDIDNLEYDCFAGSREDGLAVKFVECKDHEETFNKKSRTIYTEEFRKEFEERHKIDPEDLLKAYVRESSPNLVEITKITINPSERMTRESKVLVNNEEISFIEEITYGEKDYALYGGYNRIVFKTGHEMICKLSDEDIRRLK